MSSSISPFDIKEGTIPFSVPGLEKQCETWCKVIGPLSTPDKSSPIRPVVVVHGGPGLTHDYLKSIDELYVKFGIPVILYDQIGNGRSTHLQEKNGDAEFWSDELFEDELENLVQNLGLADNGYDILGHSWGGMMGSTFAARRPKGLRKLILSGAPALIDEWEKAYSEFLEEMDEDTKSAIKRGIEKEDWENEEYEAALMKFMSKHTVGPVWPQDILDSFGWAKKDPTVALTMMGPNEFHVVGRREHWNATEAAKKIEVPTLVINGTNEGASDAAIKPYLDYIKNVKWVKFHNSTHMQLFEERERYLDVVGKWLKGERT